MTILAVSQSVGGTVYVSADATDHDFEASNSFPVPTADGEATLHCGKNVRSAK